MTSLRSSAGKLRWVRTTWCGCREVASSIGGRTSALPAECSNLAMHCLCCTNVTSPETLGLDRVANVWAVVQGASEDPSQPWLIVDAGTCVTMDLLDRGTHIGGTISPGLQMRLTAMARGTANLPQPDLNAIVQSCVSSGDGANTTRCLPAPWAAVGRN